MSQDLGSALLEWKLCFSNPNDHQHVHAPPTTPETAYDDETTHDAHDDETAYDA